MTEPALSLSRRTNLLGLLAAAGLAILGVFGLLLLFLALGYGWDKPKGRVIPALILFFVGGIVVFQRRRSLALRALALIIATALAVSAWWLTPQNHLSLRDAAILRDELRAELSIPPTWDKAFIADQLKDKHNTLRRSSRSMAMQVDMDRWADEVGAAIDERFRTTSAEDIESAVQTNKAEYALAITFSAATSIKPRNEWIDKAVASKVHELEKVSRGDWSGFDHTAAGRNALVEAFSSSRMPLISAERKWILDTVTTSLPNIRAQMNPKLARELCHETEKQLLALNSLDASLERFSEARKLLFHAALDSAQTEIQSHIEAGRIALAYGIARKLAVDWFATAEILGPEQHKRLEDLRDKCHDLAELAEKSGELPEAVPLTAHQTLKPFMSVRPFRP